MTRQSESDRLKVLGQGLISDPRESLEKLVAFIKTQPVVDIRVARRLAAWYEALRGEDLIKSLTVQMHLMDHWFFIYFWYDVLDFIVHRRPRGRRSREESIARIGREVAADPYFRKLNQRARRYYSGTTVVPTAEVRVHNRLLPPPAGASPTTR